MEIINIDNNKYNLLKKPNKRVHRTDDWIRLYFYRNRKKTKVECVKDYDREITSSLDFNKNTLYRITAMSNQDEHFDYFFKVKDNAPKVIVKKNKRGRKRIIYPRQPFEEDDKGNVIISF
jgi:hypothetical protein